MGRIPFTTAARLVLAAVLCLLAARTVRWAAADDLDTARELLRSDDRQDRKRAVELLIALDSARAVRTLEDAVRRSLADLDRLAPKLDALDVAVEEASAAGKGVAKRAWRAMQDEMNQHLAVVASALFALDDFTSPEALEAIQRSARSESHPLLRQFYVRAVGVACGPEGVPLLIEAAEDSDPRVRALAVQGVSAYIWHHGVPAALREAAEDDVWSVRLWAYIGMAHAPFDVAVPFLIEAVGREDGEVALQIDALLSSLTGVSFADDPDLWERWWKDHEAEVRDGTYEPPAAAAAPPTARSTATFFRIPLHSTNILFAIDYSNSMNRELDLENARMDRTRAEHDLPATRLGYAKAELVDAIRSLPDGAHFNIVVYGDEARSLGSRPLRVSSSTRRKAIRWVLKRDTEWMTNIWAALRESFYDHLDAGGSSRFERIPDTIVFLTDGHATRGRFQDDHQLVLLAWLWNVAAGAKIHAVGLGKHDRDMLQRLAETTGGVYLDPTQAAPALEIPRQGVPPELRIPHRRHIAATIQRILSKGDWEERKEAVRYIGRLGPFAEPFLDLLVGALDDDDTDVREAAAETLAGLGPMAVPAAREALGSDSELATMAALDAVARMGPAATPLVDEAIRLLTHDSWEVRAGAARALGTMGRDAREAARALERATADSRDDVAEAARKALEAIGAR